VEVFSVFHPHLFQFVLVILDIRFQFLAVPLPGFIGFLNHLVVSVLPYVELQVSSKLMLHTFAKTVAKSTLRPAVALRIASRTKATGKVMATVRLFDRHPFTTSKAFAVLPVGRVHVPDVQTEDAV
jgi:hypothetical protein